MLKYNFQEMQIEYLKWPRDTVESYLSQKKVKRNWFVSKNTNWRYDIKQEIKKQAVEESKERIKESMVITNEELIKMKKTAFWLIQARLNQLVLKAPKKNKDWTFRSLEDIPTKDITDLVKTLKVELNEPTVITKWELTWKDWKDLIQNITVEIIKK